MSSNQQDLVATLVEIVKKTVRESEGFRKLVRTSPDLGRARDVVEAKWDKPATAKALALISFIYDHAQVNTIWDNSNWSRPHFLGGITEKFTARDYDANPQEENFVRIVIVAYGEILHHDGQEAFHELAKTFFPRRDA